MRVHTGLRPYKCTHCDRTFTQSNDLTLHIRRHTGEKPYVCGICGERFIQGTALQTHRRMRGHFEDPKNTGYIRPANSSQLGKIAPRVAGETEPSTAIVRPTVAPASNESAPLPTPALNFVSNYLLHGSTTLDGSGNFSLSMPLPQ